jgi:hypothetical protein
MKIVEKISNGKWAIIGSISLRGKMPRIRTAGLQVHVVDKGFDRFARHFKPEQPMAARCLVEEGPHGEMA